MLEYTGDFAEIKLPLRQELLHAAPEYTLKRQEHDIRLFLFLLLGLRLALLSGLRAIPFPLIQRYQDEAMGRVRGILHAIRLSYLSSFVWNLLNLLKRCVVW